MKIKFFRNLWGCPGPRGAAIASLLDSGYDGIEAVLFSEAERAEMRRILRRRSFPFKGTIWTRGAGPSPEDHIRLFRSQLRALERVGADSINVIGGYDCWTVEEASRYFDAVLKAGESSGLPISHETHRDSALYHPHPTRQLLERFPQLRLTCDFSHWVVACERLIEDQVDLIGLCGSRADHVHVRVGTEQAPQVSDVRSPEALPYLAAFERWWGLVWDRQLAQGIAVTTACPEFGPPPYQATLPHTGMPVADLAAICDWQRDRQAARFRAWAAGRKGSLRRRR